MAATTNIDVDELAKRVGARVHATRVGRRKSLGYVHAATGIDPSNLSKIERGEYLTTVERYAAIAASLGVSLEAFFRGVLCPSHQPSLKHRTQ